MLCEQFGFEALSSSHLLAVLNPGEFVVLLLLLKMGIEFSVGRDNDEILFVAVEVIVNILFPLFPLVPPPAPPTTTRFFPLEEAVADITLLLLLLLLFVPF